MSSGRALGSAREPSRTAGSGGSSQKQSCGCAQHSGCRWHQNQLQRHQEVRRSRLLNLRAAGRLRLPVEQLSSRPTRIERGERPLGLPAIGLAEHPCAKRAGSSGLERLSLAFFRKHSQPARWSAGGGFAGFQSKRSVPLPPLPRPSARLIGEEESSGTNSPRTNSR